jgi:hypothetical protein
VLAKLTGFGQGHRVYSVKGVVLGTRVRPDSKAYGDFTWCTKDENDKEKRGPFKAHYSILHSRDGTIVYTNRFQEPAYWGAKEVQSDIDYYSRSMGEQPTRIIKMPRSGYPNGTIATWGEAELEPVDAQSRKVLATGKSPKIGFLVDFLGGNYELSVKSDLPVYRITGGAGFVWSASYDSNGRGTLKFLAINPSAIYPGVNQPPANQPPVIAAPAPPPPASKPQVETVWWGTGFFISPEGHIVTNAHVVEGCRYIGSSRGGRLSRFALRK